MFEHLKVANIKILKECRLLNLGKINVICGKNNSGKSTLLEGINSDKHKSIGKRFTKDDATDLYKRSLHSTGWRGSNESLNNIYSSIIGQAVVDKILFSNEEGIIVEDIYNKIQNSNSLRQYQIDKGILVSTYKLLFQNLPSILLPPKRTLELDTNINVAQKPTPNGTSITNRLFLLKNQPEGSDNRKIYARICESFSEISSGYQFDINVNEGNALKLNFSYAKNSWIHAKDCGMGLQELLVILYFAIEPEYKIILIEEPESHLHPDMQRKLLYFLRNNIDKQFFLTTHSNVFLNNALVDRVFFTSLSNGEITVNDATSRASILDDLGYSVADNLLSDLVILVEGPKDVPVIEEFLIKIGLYNLYDIRIWPLGGDIMDQIDLSPLAQNYYLMGLIDKDPKSSKVRKHFTAKCKELNIEVHRLKRYSMENYFTIEALRKVFSSQIPDTLKEITPNEKLEKQIGIDVKKNNRKIAQAMDIKDIEDTDLYEFFNKVKIKCEEIAKEKK